MINVIWVDDLILNPDGSHTDMCDSIINRAYDEGIDITPFSTYEEAYREIEKAPAKWISIILDVRNDKAASGNENQDYLKIRKKIECFRENHGNSVTPFIYVFSADTATISDAKRYFRKDADIQTKEVYSKPDDINLLFEDIKKTADISPYYETYKKYEKTMKAMNKLGWDVKDKNRVFDLIHAIDSENDFNNDGLYTNFRKLLEDVLYVKLEQCGIMNGATDSQTDSKDDTINKKSVYIGKNPNVPMYVQRAFHSLTQIAQNGSHYHPTDTHLVVARDTRQGNAPYLLKSCLYDLLTIIHWESNL